MENKRNTNYLIIWDLACDKEMSKQYCKIEEELLIQLGGNQGKRI